MCSYGIILHRNSAFTVRFSLTKPPLANKIPSSINRAPPQGGAFSAKIMTEELKSTENNSQVTNLANVDADAVNAELVRMHQSSAGVVNSEEIELTFSAAAQVHAKDVEMHDSAAAVVQAEEMTVQNGAVGAAQAGTLSLNGVAGSVVAGSVEFGNAYAGFTAAREVRGERIESVVLLTRKVEGNVSTVIDTRGALIAGLVGGLFTGIMLLLGRMLFGKK